MFTGVQTRLRPLFFSLCFLIACSTPVHARFGSGLEDAEMKELKTAWDKDPGAIVKNSRVLRKLSAPQIAELMEYKDTSHYSFLHIVVVKGEELGAEALGNQNNKLSVMAVIDGRMRPIPFQIDEVDMTGLTFIPTVKKYPIDGTENIFDKQDEVAFMYRDATFERFEKGKTSLARGEVLKEIELSFENRKIRYAYLVKDNSERSDFSYVSMDEKQGNFDSTYYNMSWDPKNFSQIRNVIPKVGPEQGKNVLDSIYFEVSTGIFNKNIRFGLNSKKHIYAEILGVKQGPVRVNALVKGHVKYAGIPSMPYYLNMIFTEQSVSFRSRSTPDGYKYAKYVTTILKDPGFYVNMDFHNIDGAKISFHSIADSPEVPIVDGKMSAIEHRVNEERLPGDWFWIESGHGWSIFFSNTLPIVENGLFDAFLEGMSFHMVYEDDITKVTNYERFPGGAPRIGVEGRGLPKIALEMMSAISDIPFGEIDSMDKMSDFLIDASDKGKLKKANELIAKVLISQREQGKIKNSQEFAEAFIKDFDLVGIRGVEDRQKLNQAFRIGISKLESFESFNIGQVTRDVRAALQAQGIDASLIHYAPRDAVLWFPDSVGDKGPDGFRVEVQNPPKYKLNNI